MKIGDDDDTFLSKQLDLLFEIPVVVTAKLEVARLLPQILGAREGGWEDDGSVVVDFDGFCVNPFLG